MALSKEANKARYQYVKKKKYMERYWEKKAREANGNEETVTTTHRTTKVIVSTNLLPDLEQAEEVSVNRSECQSDEKYIAALENANKAYRKENKRLVKLLITYQHIIKLGLKAIEYENEK